MRRDTISHHIELIYPADDAHALSEKICAAFGLAPDTRTRGGACGIGMGQPGCRRDLLNLHVAKAYHGFAYLLRERVERQGDFLARVSCVRRPVIVHDDRRLYG